MNEENFKEILEEKKGWNQIVKRKRKDEERMKEEKKTIIKKADEKGLDK